MQLDNVLDASTVGVDVLIDLTDRYRRVDLERQNVQGRSVEEPVSRLKCGRWRRKRLGLAGLVIYQAVMLKTPHESETTSLGNAYARIKRRVRRGSPPAKNKVRKGSYRGVERFGDVALGEDNCNTCPRVPLFRYSAVAIVSL